MAEFAPQAGLSDEPSLDICSPVTPNSTTLDSEPQSSSQRRLCPSLMIRTAGVPFGTYLGISRVDFFQGCRRWSCQVCGPRKRAKLLKRIELGDPNRFVTLTTKQIGEETPREVFERTSPRVSKLFRKLKNDDDSFAYARILESTKRGFPHYHFCVRSKWISQQNLSNEWNRLTGAKIVDVRKLYGDKTRYVAKYLTKNDHVAYTRQRVSFSRNWPKLPKMDLEFDLAEWDSIYNDELIDYVTTFYQQSGTTDLGVAGVLHNDSDDRSKLISQLAKEFKFESELQSNND